MKKQIIVLIVLLLFLNSNYSQINPNNIEIVRDNYGVPHIYGKTDAEVAYGLAWTHSEDDFKTIQQAYLAGNGLLSKHIGVKGAPADFLTQLIESKETVDKLFNTLSPDFIKVAQGYAEGINKYAELHPKEILEKSLFPISVKKMLRYSFLQLFISNEAGRLVSSIVSNNVPRPNPIKAEMNGSNTFAFNSIKTGKNETYLAINTHQPLDGPTSWYEAHLISEEGTNIIGATFAGAPSLLIGANQNLAWAHTVNYPDKADVFELEMHPTKKWHYLVDGETYKLEKKQAKLFVKFLGIRLKVSKKYFTSIYGPTLKNKSGFYSVRTPSLFTIKSLEQWWRMNKANSFTEFYNILKKNDLPGYNIGYADKNDTIFYISNGIIPKRNDQYDWRKVVPGNTKKTLWDSYYKTEELPQVINPKSGYVYNANHSPFKSTSKEENPLAENFSKNMGYELYDNNRSTRLYDLINSYDKIDYKDFKKIKYDRTLPTPLNYNYVNINKLFKMNPDDYPEISDLLVIIQNWDREANADSFGAGAYAMMYYNLGKYYPKLKEDKVVSQKMLEECLKEVKLKMIESFGSINIRLGDYQKLVRGDKEISIFGLPDVLTAMRGVDYKDGKIKITHGESYIELVKFSKGKVEIESVISYGSSDHEDSPHYNDQMEMYSKFETKKMTFNKEKIYKNSKKIYNPK
ncbi:MAG: penicillin acylase family protein [Flavobacteriales bacterium]|jgi:acyl-homoserine-lactone acylase|tara:strand:- start:9729 stop:11789 length:2061 start_codon:yes stop_codon:yes gene_type:complete